MIYFRKLLMHNFMVYKKQTVNLYEQGVVRLEGRNLDDPGAESNMAGKSTIVEAIVWCLFGRTIRGLKADEIIGISGSASLVSLGFDSNDARFKCIRYRRNEHHGNRLRILQDGRELSSRHESATQERLEQILGFDYSTFVNSVAFGGVKPFASLTDAEQKKVLESFLHFEQVDRALAKTRAKLVQVDENISALRLEIEGQQNLIRELKAQIDSSSEVEKNIQEERTTVKQELNTLGDIRPCLKPLQRKQRFSYSLQEKKSKLSGQRESLQEKLAELQTKLQSRSSLIGQKCPVCGRIVTGQTLGATIRHLRTEKTEVGKRISSLQTTISQIQRRLKAVSQEVERLQERQRNFEDVTRRKASLRERLGSLAQIVPLSRSLEYKYSRAVSDSLIMQRKKAGLEQKQRDLRFWETGFGNKGIKAMIVRKALPWLNQTLGEYAEKIFGESVALKFAASKVLKSGKDRELFHIEYGKAAGYVGESSGGRKRVDIAILLTMAKLSRVCNLLLVDEILDGLDAAGREQVLEILATLRGTVLCISHSKDLKGNIGTTWTVTKQNGISKLEAV